VEQLSSLRAIPGLTVVRPGDANETGEAWRLALKHRHGPVALALTRQKLPFIDRSEYAGADGVARGAYVLTKDGDAAPEVVIIATGSEVSLAVGAHKELTRAGIRARVVSMPSQEVFAAQDEGYRDSVLPPGIPRVAVEAGHPMSWYRWVGDTGTVIGIDHYGASAPYKTVFEAFGFTVAHVTAAAHALVGR
jgi:transketolase